MAQQGTSGESLEQGYRETVAPENPPNAVTRPAVRTAALATFLGGIIVVFLIVAAMLLFWKVSDEGTRAGQREDSSAVGTAGENPSQTSPGGSDPAAKPNNTKDEIEYRGGSGK